jgi:putative glutamine amidotransferase
MADRPLIGITLDYQEKGTFSQRPHYAVRTIYFAAVEAAGGLPIAIPHLADRLPEYMKLIDGLVIPGGTHASPESWYVDLNEPAPYEETPRAAFDIAVVEQALKRDMPLLGICAGMQELACVAGAKMTRNVHKHHNTEINHRQGATADQYAHEVVVEPGTRLAQIIGTGKIDVNTAHQEAVVSVPKDMTISARSPDGVIEAIELPKHKFALGVQWHPEFFLQAGNPHRKVFEALVAAAKG